jgi:hypothetical protein
MPRPEVPLSTIARQVDLGFNRKERKRSKQPFRNRVQYHDIFQVSYQRGRKVEIDYPYDDSQI